MANNIFYLSWAHVLESESLTEYKVWLVDYSNKVLMDSIGDGTVVIPEEACLHVNVDYILGEPVPEVHFLRSYLNYELTTLVSGLNPVSPSLTALVTIHQSLWKKIPEKHRPAPPLRNQTYRLQITTTGLGASLRAYAGYHVLVLEVNAARLHLLFFSWTGRVLGNGWFAMHPSQFDFESSGIGPWSMAGDQGSLFVSMDLLSDLPFMSLAKVPFSGQV